MASNLKDRACAMVRRIKRRSLRHAVKTADHHILENLDVAREALRISNEILQKNREIFDLVEGLRDRGAETADRAEAILSENRDTIHIVDEIRRQIEAYENRFRRMELYMLHLMKQSGVALETLSVGDSSSQLPATNNDIRFLKLEITKGSVIKIVNFIRTMTEAQCRDVEFLEHTLIPGLGLAEENWTFPSEIAHLSGKGLHLLQLPCQVAPLLAWLADNARGMENYLEIGVRWGGMFILISEWLRRFSPELRRTVALDPAEMSPLIREYANFIGKSDGHDRLEVRYVKEFSTSAAAKDMVLNLKPDFVFIDGDHSYESVSHDYELVRGYAKMLMFHDICASNWPGVGRLWREALEQNADAEAAVEFTKQYPSGDGGGMGLGVIKMRAPSSRPQGGDTHCTSSKTEGGPGFVF